MYFSNQRRSSTPITRYGTSRVGSKDPTLCDKQFAVDLNLGREISVSFPMRSKREILLPSSRERPCSDTQEKPRVPPQIRRTQHRKPE